MKSKFIGKLLPGIQGYLAPANAGKSQLLLTDAVDLAREGYHVTVINAEQTIEDIVKRIMLIAGDEFETVSHYLTVKCIPYGKLTNSEIVNVLKSDCDVCIVDYLDLLHNKEVPMSFWLSNVMSTINHFAKQSGKVLLTAVQMNRQGAISGELSQSESEYLDEFNFHIVKRDGYMCEVDGRPWDIFSCLAKK